MKKAIMSYAADVRAASTGEGRTISGTAAVYNAKSLDLGGFREVILPGAFTKTLSEGGTKKAYWNHNSDQVLGSTKSGTLRLSEREEGLHFEIDPPAWADHHLESIKRGDVDQMSFGFRTVKDSWEHKDGEVVRLLHEVQLFEISPVAMPAYPQTDAQARSIPAELLPTVAELATDENAQAWRAEVRALIAEQDAAHHSQPDQAPLSDEPDQGTTGEPDERDQPDDMDVCIDDQKLFIGV
jgi:HK97 family phage prohead protease